MAKEVKRIDIGFHGGQVLPVRVETKAYEGLRDALSDDGAGRWHQLKTQDSEIAVDLSQVVYVRLDIEDSRVGF
ncbi:MAG TPA: hypothetical protein VEQ61_09490 [Thermoleophilaceae bacterium]|nr:hypothetical protein [Thermoleophilaceae bacterium]